MIPKEALDYIKNKKLYPAFSYRDVWNEEHAANFTVAKAMQIDVLSDIKKAVEQAIEKGETFDHFKKNLAPVLQKKGWWYKKKIDDPVTGKTVNAQLGSDRRLKTIYDTNLRSAYNQGRYERSMASTAHPYFLYRIGPSKKHRDIHTTWEGILLPKDDPWWNNHYPPNGWGCKCWVRAVSEDQKEKLLNQGITIPETVDGTPAHTVPVKTTPSPTRYKTWVDNRTGRVEKIPEGIGPGFNWNPGLVGREVPIFDSFMEKGKNGFPEQYESLAKTILTNQTKIDEFNSFIDRAYKGEIREHYATPVGFIESHVASWLKRNENIETGDSVTIALEARLLTGPKAVRHLKAGDAIDKEGALNLIETILYGQVYFDKLKNTLIYLFPHSMGKLTKITVKPIKELSAKGSSIKGPVVVNLETIGADKTDEEYFRITETLKKIR